MRKLIARYIAFPAQDIINSTEILKTRDFLLESQNWPQKKLEEYRIRKLQHIISYAYNNVPYYNSLFKATRITPADIKDFNDLLKIPVLTKDIARREAKNLVDVNIKSYKTRNGATGGTSGVPLPVYQNPNELNFVWGAYYRWYSWFGLDPWDSMAILWGQRTIIKNVRKNQIKTHLKDFYYNRLTINTFKLNQTQIPHVLEQISNFQPKILRGYLSTLIIVANYIRANNIKLNFKPKIISPTTETLLPPYRELLENVFNAPVFDQYGCGESNSISFECPAHKGMHINSEHIHLEDLKISGVQKVILTNLDNLAMPFIRYENGDSVEFSAQPCTCGMPHTLISRIIGRSPDGIVLDNGSKVHGVFFTDILREIFGDFTLNIRRFQIYQYKNGHTEFRLEPLTSFSKMDKEKLLQASKEFISDIEIVEMPELPSDSSGKFRYVITEL